MTVDQPVRVGVLGASRVAVYALLEPAKECPDVRIAGVASRDAARARTYAAAHGLSAFDSYDDMLRSEQIDAVYVAVPNSQHCEWTVRALEAGKHVLCEKPLASNAAEAMHMIAAADRTGRLLMEAHHSAFHPAYHRLREIIASGEVGTVERVDVKFLSRVPQSNALRFRYELGGGASMDVGCYAVRLARFVTAEEPSVVSAEAIVTQPNVDGRMDAVLAFASGATGTVACSLIERFWNFRFTLAVRGTAGSLKATSPWAPQLFFHSISITDDRGRVRRDRVAARFPATYVHQLHAFARATRDPRANLAIDAQRTMTVIDNMYLRAGLPLRGQLNGLVNGQS
jgi:predicted dehydrogenase